MNFKIQIYHKSCQNALRGWVLLKNQSLVPKDMQEKVWCFYLAGPHLYENLPYYNFYVIFKA